MRQTLVREICEGAQLSLEEALALACEPLEELIQAANTVRRECCGEHFHLCTIVNGKSGRCTENCAYCAQSAHFCTGAQEYERLGLGEILSAAGDSEAKGVERFSIVTSGRQLENGEVEDFCSIYRTLRETYRIGLCASHGLLRLTQLKMLRDAGVSRYHNNLETSARFFPKICTTHTYEDKLQTIREAKQAGLEVCSGGIIGLGETMEDRLQMALTLRQLQVDSVPVNLLTPIPGTPMEGRDPLSEEEILRTMALLRLLLPGIPLRLAGGRILLRDRGEGAMGAGVNAAITGDMLTTQGSTTAGDYDLAARAGYTTVGTGADSPAVV